MATNEESQDHEVTMTCRQCRQPITQMLSRFHLPDSRCPQCHALLRSKRLTVPVNLTENIKGIFKRFSAK
jgi:Zn finger protein HypA/HybF involved in hydrogenase expression